MPRPAPPPPFFDAPERPALCPAQPASAAERSSNVTLTSQDRESLSALAERLGQLAEAITQQNQVLMQIVAINQDMLEELVGSDDSEEPKRDLAGRPLT